MHESSKSSKIPNIVTPKGFGHLLLIMYSLKICFFFSECNKKFCTNFSSKYNTWSKVCANLGTKHRYCFDFYHMVNILVQTSRELFIKFNIQTNYAFAGCVEFNLDFWRFCFQSWLSILIFSKFIMGKQITLFCSLFLKHELPPVAALPIRLLFILPTQLYCLVQASFFASSLLSHR